MSLLQRFSNAGVRTLAVAALGVAALAAFGDAASARDHRGDYGRPSVEFDRRGHGHHRGPGRDFYQTRCDAVAFRRGGAVLAGTHGDAIRNSPREACGAALAECERKLDRKRRFDRFPYPFARCDVTRTQQIAQKGKRGGATIVLKF